jgi:hypothetical protein
MKSNKHTNLNESLEEKWGGFLDDKAFGEIKDPHRRAVTGVILENCERLFNSSPSSGSLLAESDLYEAAAANNAGSYPNAPMAAPVTALMPIIRRAQPLMIAYDIVGVQPMMQASQSIFSLRSRKTSQSGDEILFGEE